MAETWHRDWHQKVMRHYFLACCFLACRACLLSAADSTTVAIVQINESSSAWMTITLPANGSMRGPTGGTICVRMLESEDTLPMPDETPRLVLTTELKQSQFKPQSTDKDRIKSWEATVEVELTDFRRVYGVHRGRFRVEVQAFEREFHYVAQWNATKEQVLRTLPTDELAWSKWNYELKDPIGILPRDKAIEELHGWISRYKSDAELVRHAAWRLVHMGERLSPAELQSFFVGLRAVDEVSPPGPIHSVITALGTEAGPYLLELFVDGKKWPIEFLERAGGPATVEVLAKRLKSGDLDSRGQRVLSLIGGEAADELLMTSITWPENNPEVQLLAAQEFMSATSRHKLALQLLSYWAKLGRVSRDYSAVVRPLNQLNPGKLHVEDLPGIILALKNNRVEPVRAASVVLGKSRLPQAAIALADGLQSATRNTDWPHPQPEDFIEGLRLMPSEALRQEPVRKALETYRPKEFPVGHSNHDRGDVDAARVRVASLLMRIDSTAYFNIALDAFRNCQRGEDWSELVEGLTTNRPAFEAVCLEMLKASERWQRDQALTALEKLKSIAWLDVLLQRPEIPAADDEKASLFGRWTEHEALAIARQIPLSKLSACLSAFNPNSPVFYGKRYGLAYRDKLDFVELVSIVRASAKEQQDPFPSLLTSYEKLVDLRRSSAHGRGAPPPDAVANQWPLEILALRVHSSDELNVLLHSNDSALRLLGVRLTAAARARSEEDLLYRELADLTNDTSSEIRFEAAWALHAGRYNNPSIPLAETQLRRVLVEGDKTTVETLLKRLEPSSDHDWIVKGLRWSLRESIERASGAIVAPNEFPIGHEMEYLPYARQAKEKILASLERNRLSEEICLPTQLLVQAAQTRKSEGHQRIIEELAASPYERLRQNVASNLCVRDPAQVAYPLPSWVEDMQKRFLRDPDIYVRRAAMRYFTHVKNPAVTPLLVAMLAELPNDAKFECIDALACQRDPATLPILLTQLALPGLNMRRSCVFALEKLHDPIVIPNLWQALADSPREIQALLLKIIAELGDDAQKQKACLKWVELVDAENIWISSAPECQDVMRYAVLKKLDRITDPQLRAKWEYEMRQHWCRDKWATAYHAECARTTSAGSIKDNIYLAEIGFGSGELGREAVLKWFHLTRGRQE